MRTFPETRQGHAVLDLPSRNDKARKIASLLGVAPDGPKKRMLEVGCGSGGISHWFGEAGVMGWSVDAVDVEDVRLVKEGFEFQAVTGTILPFADATFDVVISNHVIEHVGGDDDQREHLSELRRVLRPGGEVYLAAPSRWMVIEPHFRLPLLSWLPLPLSNTYLRLARKGKYYDCRPLSCRRMEGMLEEAGFTWRQHTTDALHLTFQLERPQALIYRYVLSKIPDRVYNASRGVFPTLIYTLKVR